jgi:hypothetical protein
MTSVTHTLDGNVTSVANSNTTYHGYVTITKQ